MKYLGIDYGTKRIGVAVSDDIGVLAFPLTTFPAGKGLLLKVVELAAENSVKMIVLGESRNFKQEQNPIMKEVTEFKKALEEKGFTVVYEPEFMSSAAAARQYTPEEKTRKANPSQEKLDAAAAAIVLQSYLDKMKNNG